MSTTCNKIVNLRSGLSIIKNGNNNGYTSYLGQERGSPFPNQILGNQDNPLRIDTVGDGRVSWEIYDESWKLFVCVSVDGGACIRVGTIKILDTWTIFNLWISDNSIVIESENGKLGRISDDKPFRFFLATTDGIVESDDATCLLNAW